MTVPPEQFTIGQLSHVTGCKVPTIRYFEQIGLLPAPGRSAGNTRMFDASHRVRLDFIQHCRELGFSQTAIRGLLGLTNHPDWSCAAATKIARGHLDDIDRRITRLTDLKGELERMIKDCDGGRIEQCRIIETLADHSHTHCLANNHGPTARSNA